MKTLYKVIIGIFVLSVALLGVDSFIRSNYFKIKHIEVIPVEYSESMNMSDIKEASNKFIGHHIWLLDLNDLFEELKKITYIRDIKIYRRFPGSLGNSKTRAFGNW